MDVLDWLFSAQLTVAGVPLLWREVIGNLFGLASAVGGLRRRCKERSNKKPEEEQK